MVVKKIHIDAGHGGLDPGGGTNTHFKEKDMVLDISKEQKRHFERNGISVTMSRTTDEYLDSVPRTNRVKASGAQYCISNHINAGGGEGAETIHSIYATETIARGILNALVAQGARNRRVFTKRGTSGDFYYMHRMTGTVNTVIVEYGFADNVRDTQKIIKDWKKYAEAVSRYYIENVFKQKYVPEASSPAPAPDTKTPVTSPPESGVKLYAPTSLAIKESTERVLQELEKEEEQPLSDQWRKKLGEGTLTDSDAIGLLYVAIDRGYNITGGM